MVAPSGREKEESSGETPNSSLVMEVVSGRVRVDDDGRYVVTCVVEVETEG